MKAPRRLLALGLAGGVALGALACRLPRESAPSRYWLLTPREGQVPQEPIQRAVGIGPIELPGYLDQPNLVTRSAPGRLRVAALDLWGESLERSIIRVLGRNLEMQVPGLAAVPFPWKGPSQDLKLRLVMQISRFEAGPDDAVHLDATWALQRGAGGEMLTDGHAAIREPLEGDGTEAVVAAMSGALARLGDQIAAGVPPPDPGPGL